MSATDFVYVRKELEQPLPPPASQHGPVHWIRTNLFASPLDSVLTIFGLLVIAYFLPPILSWVFINAQWTGSDRSVCATVAQGGVQPDGWAGACWAFVWAKFGQFMFNNYPLAERWRVILCGAMLVALIVPFLIPRAPYKALNAILLFGVLPIVGYFLFIGGTFGLRYVPTREWGGFMVTIILSYVGIVVSLPMGVLLALGRKSELPVIKMLSVIFIEMVRGVPLITVLFMATKMLPLFMPNSMKPDDFLCVLIGVSIFASAYMAEVIRGGLQAMPKGQYEGADSLGLNYWQKMRLIILPQALKLVIPGIVNTFIGLFKDTSLVYIVNMFDLLGAVRRNFSDPTWISPQTPMTGLVFAGFVFWIFCFGMSRYSIYMENRLDRGHKR
ncbi:amino acid ABC transporter permease [Oryzicola mucosus]|uniref:Amino acid ABC transporter permease n=1 Tax=Oryzicola mucosus TaxID=2767425 RepID=A0A8J6PIW0_9HYPH|nr:amino acid ABC transporter permease [Oryzicola mucosus]MBD0415744.1 amino acid ABC transporter permease [Oryzicola mucosus]